VCSMVPIPAEADEDARRRMREREELLAEPVGLVNRIGAILATLGVGEYNPIRRDRCQRLDELRTAIGGSLPMRGRWPKCCGQAGSRRFTSNPRTAIVLRRCSALATVGQGQSFAWQPDAGGFRWN
jgi:hypothetical protein